MCHFIWTYIDCWRDIGLHLFLSTNLTPGCTTLFLKWSYHQPDARLHAWPHHFILKMIISSTVTALWPGRGVGHVIIFFDTIVSRCKQTSLLHLLHCWVKALRKHSVGTCFEIIYCWYGIADHVWRSGWSLRVFHSECMSNVRAWVRARARVCVCVCVWEREREREIGQYSMGHLPHQIPICR